MSFRHASGTYKVEEWRPASAFTTGDLLMFDSTSSVSRIAELMASGVDIAGVAQCNSAQSINGRVPVLIPNADTLFWASTHSATGSGMTPGQEFDVSYALANGGQFVTTSADSVRVVIVRGTIGANAVDQSIVSQVLCKLIYHASNVEIS
jgi:hypothetical protein